MSLYTSILGKFGITTNTRDVRHDKSTEQPRVRRLRLTDAASGEEVDEVEWLGADFIDTFAGHSRLPHGVSLQEDDLPPNVWRLPSSAKLPTPSTEDILNARWGMFNGVLRHGKLQHEHCYDGKVFPVLEMDKRDIHFALHRDELDDEGILTRKHYHWHTELLDEIPSDDHVTMHKLNLYFIWLNSVPVYHFWLGNDELKPFPIRSNCGRAVSEVERLAATRASAILAATQHSPSSPQRTPTKQVKISPTVSQRFFDEREPLSAFSTSSRGERDSETPLPLPKPPKRSSLANHTTSQRNVRSLSQDNTPTAISTPTRFKRGGRARRARRDSDDNYIADEEDEGMVSSEPSPVLITRKRKAADDPEANFRMPQQSPTTDGTDIELPKTKRKRNVTKQPKKAQTGAPPPPPSLPQPLSPAEKLERKAKVVKELNTNLEYLTQEIASASLRPKRNSSASHVSAVRDGHTFLDYALPGNRGTARGHLLVQIADERKLLAETFAQLPAKLAHPEQEVRYRPTVNNPENKSFIGRAVDVFKARKDYLDKMLDQAHNGVHDDKVHTALIEELISIVESSRQLLAELKSEDFAVASVEAESDVSSPTESEIDAETALMLAEEEAALLAAPATAKFAKKPWVRAPSPPGTGKRKAWDFEKKKYPLRSRVGLVAWPEQPMDRARERSAAPSPPAPAQKATASMSSTAAVRGGDSEETPKKKLRVSARKTGKKVGK